MDIEVQELVFYRFRRAEETLQVANKLLLDGNYKDANNRSYYAAFYAIKAVYALQKMDFKKHKTLLSNFNREYVACGIFPREYGKGISKLALIREQSDYDDFYVATKEECSRQLEFTHRLIEAIKEYLDKQGVWLE